MRSIELGDRRRVRQDQGQYAGITRGDRASGPVTDRRSRRSRCPGPVVRALQTEILAPVEQDVGSRIAAQEIAQAAKFGRMLFVEENRFQIEPVEQDEPAQAVGPVDRPCIAPKLFRDPGHELAYRGLLACIPREQFGFCVRLGVESRRSRGDVHARAGPVGAAPPGLAGFNASLKKTPRAAMNRARARIRFIDDPVVRADRPSKSGTEISSDTIVMAKRAE